MESLFQPFLALLPESAQIFVVSCSSFKNKGYKVDPIDYSEELVKKATRLTQSITSSLGQYPSDTGHNFLLADSNCNFNKSNLLSSDEFLHKWQERNEAQDLIIGSDISTWFSNR